jgi:predicted esterase
MQLPETAVLSIRAPAGMPFELEGYHWGDDIVFDQASDHIDMDSGFKHSTDLLQHVIKALREKCRYSPRQIVYFGFGQGGMVALGVAAEMGEEHGGVVSIGGPLSSAVVAEVGKKCKSPVLVCRAKANSAVGEKEVERMKDVFEFVSVREWRRDGDGMPGNREEVR